MLLANLTFVKTIFCPRNNSIARTRYKYKIENANGTQHCTQCVSNLTKSFPYKLMGCDGLID